MRGLSPRFHYDQTLWSAARYLKLERAGLFPACSLLVDDLREIDSSGADEGLRLFISVGVNNVDKDNGLADGDAGRQRDGDLLGPQRVLAGVSLVNSDFGGGLRRRLCPGSGVRVEIAVLFVHVIQILCSCCLLPPQSII